MDINVRDLTNNPEPDRRPDGTPLNVEPRAATNPVHDEVVEVSSQPKKITLHNGKEVLLKKPEGVVSLMLARIMGNDSFNPALNMYYRGLYCVAEINGERIRPPKSDVEFEAIANRLGGEMAFNELIVQYQIWMGIIDENGQPVTGGDDDSVKK